MQEAMASQGSGLGADGHMVPARAGAKTGPDEERVLAWVRTGWGALHATGLLGRSEMREMIRTLRSPGGPRPCHASQSVSLTLKLVSEAEIGELVRGSESRGAAIRAQVGALIEGATSSGLRGGARDHGRRPHNRAV